MKIYAFEVRNDEREHFENLMKNYDVEIIMDSGILTLEKIQTLEAGSGVSILGLMNYGPTELDALKERGVFYMSTRTIGYNHIDVEYAKKIGIHVCNSNYAPNGVADYTVMMILLCLRHYKQALWRINVNDYSLGGLIGKEMKDLTIGIMGTGRIGATVIQNLSGFGCRILAYDVYENEAVKEYATYVGLDELYAECDIISLHMPLLPSTHHIINHESINKMKDGVVLINCARGSLMDVKSLIDNIETGKIGALGLDCIEFEENIVHKDLRTDILSNRDMAYIRQFKNVVYTQHMAFYTDAAVKSMVECGILGIMNMANGVEFANQLA